MQGDSFEKADDSEIRSYDSPGTKIEEQLRSRKRKGMIAGLLFLMAPVIVGFIVYFIQASPLQFMVQPLLAAAFVSIILGFVILVYYGFIASGKLSAYEKLKVLGPPDPVVGNSYVMVEIEDVYVVATAWSRFFHFVAFKDKTAIMASTKIRLPKLFLKGKDRVEAGGVELYRREGVFSIPTTRGDYVSGEAVMYAEAYMPSQSNWEVPDFTKEEILAIAKAVSEDAAKSRLA